MEKVNYVLDHNETKVICYGYKIETKYKHKIDKFDTDSGNMDTNSKWMIYWI